jgi:hypothetical protein
MFAGTIPIFGWLNHHLFAGLNHPFLMVKISTMGK